MDYIGKVFVVLEETTNLSSKVPVFGGVSVRDFGHSSRYVLVSHCSFNLHLCGHMWNIFSYVYLLSDNLLWFERSVKVFGSFLNWVVFLRLNFRFYFVYFRQQFIYQMCLFSNTFSQSSVAYLLIFLTSSLTEQNFLILMQFCL